MREPLAISIAAFVIALASSWVLISCGAAIPPPLREELAGAPPGTVTIVSFTDFQCPFCRRTHAALAPLVAEQRGRVRVVVRHVPLRMHPDARTAARAAVCVESLPVYHEFVDALYAASDLGDSACEALAVSRGVDRESFRRCVVDPATDARVDRDIAMFDALSGDGVPLLYVGRHALEGAQTRQSLEAAIAIAARDLGLPAFQGPNPAMHTSP